MVQSRPPARRPCPGSPGELVMTVDRMLPSREAADLLALTRELADAELAPRVAEARARRIVPARGLQASLGAAGPAGPAVSRGRWAAAASRTRSTCRCSRSSPRGWAASRSRVSVHTLSCFPLATFGTEEQQRATGCPTCSAAALLGRLLPVRAARRLRRRRRCACQARAATAAARHHRRPRPGSPTAGRPTSTRCSPARLRRRTTGISLLPRARPTCPGFARAARGEDGPDRRPTTAASTATTSRSPPTG